MKITDSFQKVKTVSVKTVKAGANRFNGFSKSKKTITIIAIVLILSLLCFFILGKKDDQTKELSYIEVQAAVGNITETIEQSGVVEPYERYEITALVRGEIISSPFEEGDMVEEGDTLYQIDDEDAQLNMERAQMNLEESAENVNNLSIYAPASGKLSEFKLEVGNNIGAGIIGKIDNAEKMNIDIPFSISDFNKITVGDRVTATSALYMTTLSGTVTHKYTANADLGTDGSVVRNIEIEIKNPGALADGTTFAATVHTASGDVNSAGSGTIQGGTTTDVRAEVSGEVSYIGVKNGDYVQKGQLIARLTNRALVNSHKSNQLNVKSNQKTLDNYNITSPISGTIITKNSKAGDKIDNSNAATVMMVVADMSKMKFTITVDELDIADIKLGQTAVVDADAIPETSFEAKVTNIASEGVSSGDGVTTFTVELTIDEPGELKSGMNVNANILINEAYDVITIPEDALMSVRGTNASVLVKTDKNVKTDDSTTEQKQQDNSKAQGERPEGMPNEEMPQRPEGMPNGERPQRPESMPNGEIPQRAEGMPEGKMPEMPQNMPKGTMPENRKAGSDNVRGGSNIPDGYEIRQVVIGISDGTNIEIVSGLSEGEIVAYIPTTASSGNSFMMGGMMMGGMPGGMGGRMPSGGMMGGGNRNGGMPTGGNRQGGMPGGR